jgi:hypothetical protein
MDYQPISFSNNHRPTIVHMWNKHVVNNFTDWNPIVVMVYCICIFQKRVRAQVSSWLTRKLHFMSSCFDYDWKIVLKKLRTCFTKLQLELNNNAIFIELLVIYIFETERSPDREIICEHIEIFAFVFQTRCIK